jgi:hypothetical protein
VVASRIRSSSVVVVDVSVTVTARPSLPLGLHGERREVVPPDGRRRLTPLGGRRLQRGVVREMRETTVIEAATPGVVVAARCEEGRRTDATLTEWTVGSVA